MAEGVVVTKKAKAEEPAKPSEPVSKAPVKEPITTPRELGAKALATPHVRHLARELGIDINQVPGSGKEGQVTAEDLKNWAGKGSLKVPLHHL